MEISMVEHIVKLINEIGFPIAICLLMVWVNQKNFRLYIETIDRLEQVLTQNNELMGRLKDKIGE